MRALVDALETSNGKARGVAVVGAKISDGELAALDRAGVRGVRFNFLPRLVDATPHEVYLGIAERIARAGLAHRRLFRGADRSTPSRRS